MIEIYSRVIMGMRGKEDIMWWGAIVGFAIGFWLSYSFIFLLTL